MDTFDLVIVGAGTAGLSAGIYAARARRSTLILDRKRPGGQAATTEKMENYPGFPGSIGGRELMDRFKKHAEEMGAGIERAEVVSFRQEGDCYIVSAKEGGPWRARGLILAPGCEPRRLGIPGEGELSGRGVSYCATCDAELYDGAAVVVVGSGDTAVEEAGFISRFARKVIMVVVHDEGVLDCNSTQAQTALANPRLEWLWNRSVLAIEGSDAVQGVTLRNLRTGTEEKVACDGVFIFVGTVPQTGFLADFVALRNGFVITDEKMETNRPRVFAAGDARITTLRQVVTAASDGAVAAFCADKALTEIDELAKAVARAGERHLLYFYSPPVQRSLDLFPVVEQKARELGLPLIKLDTFRYRAAASRYNVREVPQLLKIDGSKAVEVVDVPSEKERR
jgi:thioredoxin reductase (NADPH)